jgi:putative ABC transport system permease protein
MRTGYSWIDLKLAGRMLLRFPGFTLISTIGLAVGIAISAAAFVIVTAMMDPTLPLPDGHRIVSVLARDVSTSRSEERLLPDFASWQRATTLQDAGVVRPVTRNLLRPGAVPETVTLAEMSASGFRVAGVSPLMGRHLLDTDESPAAPAVVVVGYTEWQRRFEADPAIIGRQVQIGERVHTIVGVMPDGFAFPVSDSFWIPWQVDATAFTPRTGPAVNVFAKLAPGATLDHAQTELANIGLALGTASPATHEHLRPIVVPYTFAYTEMHDPDNAMAFRAIQIALALLLMVVCVNVAILVYARTATRQGEIAVRTALGASRGRIVGQLFLEALALAGIGAVVGLLLVRVGIDRLDVAVQQLTGPLPFWMELRLTSAGVLYIAGLTVLAAAVIGVIPALKATGGQVRDRLQGLSGGGGSQMQMGRVWTGLIITQVALTVALLPASLFHAWDSLRSRTPDSSIAGQQLLTAGVGMERSPETAADPAKQDVFNTRYGVRLTELESRLEREPLVDGVTFSLVNAGTELAMIAEAEGRPVPDEAINYNIVEGSSFGHLVRFNRVAPDFFEVYGVPFQFGQTARPGAPSVVVNRTLVDRIFGGENPIGQRIRYVGRSREAGVGNAALNQWFEIVGVVPDFPFSHAVESRRDARVYHAVTPGESFPMTLVVRVTGGNPSDLAGRVRDISAAVDPSLQLRDMGSYQDVMKREEGVLRIVGVSTAAAIGSVIMLSAAGIYALMSFTVSRRRKEIGIRTALGANQQHILRGIFARVLRQLSAGAALGLIGAFLIDQLLEGDGVMEQAWIILPISIGVMIAVGLLASWGPARQGLRLHPIDALRDN